MRDALARALACPNCRGPVALADLACPRCALTFPVLDGSPVLLLPDHPLRAQLITQGAREPQGRLRRMRNWVVSSIKPEDRVWSRASRRAIGRALAEVDAADPGRLVINLGAGLERIFRRSIARHPAVARVGLPHQGRVDVYGDLQQFPLLSGSADLVMSCSVLEHVVDPERGVAEMARVTRAGGLVYAEIPFMRSFHMAPADFQRYTYSGIEQLFARHGFTTVEKGVCSGPFNAWALMVFDLVNARSGGGSPSVPARLVHAAVHPFKYLDRLVEDSPRAIVQACAFYYLGRRDPEPR